MTRPDVVVVGSGPNGLAAAVTLARAGLGVTGPGGAADRRRRRADARPRAWPTGSRTTSAPRCTRWPGRRRSSASSTCRRAGSSSLVPEVSYAQPLPGGRAGMAYRDLERTVEALGVDGAVWRSLVGGDRGRRGAGGARRQAVGARWSTRGPRCGSGSACSSRARARGTAGSSTTSPPRCSPGVAAHAISPLPSFAAAGTALLLATLAHAEGGWPIPRGGSGAITAALVADLEAHGGTDPHRPPGAHARPTCRSRTATCSTPPRGRWSTCSATASPRGRGPRWTRSSTATRRPRSTSCSTVRCRGPCPTSGGPAPCTSAARAPRWPARRTRSRAASTRTCR